jgi:hypothetical protein
MRDETPYGDWREKLFPYPPSSARVLALYSQTVELRAPQ